MSQKTKTDFKMTPEQLELADRLTALQRKTVINVVKGMNYTDAYREAGGNAKKDSTAHSCVSTMLSNVKVKAFYDSLLQQSVSDAIMSREEALATLSNIARTTVQDVVEFRKAQVGEDENGDPVYQTVWEMTESGGIDESTAASIAELSSGKDGFRFKLHSQPQAIKQLSDMQGWEAPKRHEVAGGNGGKIELDVSSEQVASAVTDLLDKL